MVLLEHWVMKVALDPVVQVQHSVSCHCHLLVCIQQVQPLTLCLREAKCMSGIHGVVHHLQQEHHQSMKEGSHKKFRKQE